MELNLEINNLAKAPIKKPFIKAVVLEALRLSEIASFEDKEISLSFAWITEEEMKKLNRIYRKKDSVTDVLSFSEFRSRKEVEAAKGEVFLGELILCYNYIKEYPAIKKKKGGEDAVSKELAKVIAHGVLHLCGFRHGKKMFTIQEKAAEQVFHKN